MVTTTGWDFPRAATSVALLVEFAEGHGIPAETVLDGTGLGADVIAAPARPGEAPAQVEAHQELAVVRNILRRGGDPARLGLAAGRLYHATSYGIWGYAVTSSRTVGEAIALALRYIELTYVFCVPELRTDGEAVHLDCLDAGVPYDVKDFLLARDLAAIVTLMREQIGLPEHIGEVRVRLPRPADTTAFHEVLGTVPEFGAELTGVSFPSRLLETPMPQANAHTAAMCEDECRRLVAARRRRRGVAGQVRDALLSAGGLSRDMESVAAGLSMTGRTLRRRLAAEGTSFRALLDEVRESMAEELLTAQALSVEQVARRLGYGEAAAFIHAFTRWKGIPPREFSRRTGARRREGAR
ncbi:AraC family transcriptional regulator [Prauserella marina]|uniref:AraC-type DNA-binding protein n=1 Tax=Prauserella marina TaxID=530584 RepID=A0A222VSB5_9PSEU|nr:AraC family transcriptional regulator [Prauserella marina]ASR36826.1 AraC family transcriptional regulator [Prauserella marina]PWV80261.1 AraC family transcriptional regulator [Prauserella marina]SDD50483.1 AraC-type DNA-binding protein [Prauserella marina]